MIEKLAKFEVETWLASARRVALVASVPLLLASAPARAEPAAPSDGGHEHEQFFMRFMLGPSYLLATTSLSDQDLTVRGPGGTFQVALGYNIVPKLIVYAEVFDHITFGPDVSIGDSDPSLEGLTLGLTGIGAGLGYYLPRNVCVSASASLVRLEATEGDASDRSDLGGGVNLVISKEWWVSRDWALGAALQVLVGSVPDDQVDDSWAVAAVGAGLSVTYD